MLNEKKYLCPVCGYSDLDEPAYDEYGCASFEICPSCGTEFGYSDAGFTHEQLRKDWISSGHRWAGVRQAPTDWDPIAQLKKAGFM